MPEIAPAATGAAGWLGARATGVGGGRYVVDRVAGNAGRGVAVGFGSRWIASTLGGAGWLAPGEIRPLVSLTSGCVALNAGYDTSCRYEDWTASDEATSCAIRTVSG